MALSRALDAARNRFPTRGLVNSFREAVKEQRPVETVEDFKLRIAAIIRAKPEDIPAPPRPRKRATNRTAKRRKTRVEA